jgi:hypothetical protein
MKLRLALLVAMTACTIYPFAQSSPFNIHIEPMTISGLNGLQAYAFGTFDGKWLLLGGRVDGLHRRQPFAAFDPAYNNDQVIVVDPITQQSWTASLSTLSIDLQEQLSSTNMEFHQKGNYLYILGGYGYNDETGAKKTFDFLTAVDLQATIEAVMNGNEIVSHFRQISDPQFAVTGGQLEMIGETFYLIGGNKFDGNYNPMGGPTYTQVYTNSIRKFTITDDGTSLSITHLPEIIDEDNLHRRDYNVAPQILPTGTEGITAFSGVFQPTVNLPYLNCVNIDENGYTVNNEFQQYYNHYHCAVLPIYSLLSNEMHSVFFGGIAQYYDSLGVLVQDDNVPFVKTIARVTRNASGEMAEYKLPVEMPEFLGAASEFIPNEEVSHYENGVFKLDEFTEDSTLVGYIYGGISSTAKNIFFTNTGSQSDASDQIYKVYVLNDQSSGIHALNSQSVGSLKMQVYPNPNDGKFTINFHLKQQSDTKISIQQLDGQVIAEETLHALKAGGNTYHWNSNALNLSGAYLITISTAFEKSMQKVFIHQK